MENPPNCALQVGTYSVLQSLTPVLQLVITGVERERLHNVSSCPQELSVQLTHWRERADRIMLEC